MTIKKVSLLFASLALTIALSKASNSEPHQITPISWIIATQHNGDVEGKHVTLVGHVIKPDQGSDWWFSDATGSVRLDTDDKELPVGPLLKVSGDIDQSKLGVGYLEIEVTHWSYANKNTSAR
jgi:uncharacterized protein YdeI (BOF family)